jgi:maltooligosyltrehalose trehalohydrolase
MATDELSLVVDRRLPVGAEIGPDGITRFRVWAPKRQRVRVALFSVGGQGEQSQIELMPDEDGYFSGVGSIAQPGMRYGFLLDDEETLYADPASRFQPNGVDGPSEIVDPLAYQWSDAQWRGVEPQGQVLYEMHIGTFTPEGTWEAAIGQLAELKRLGITVLEVMPVADFAGRFGWGYDGVSLFAPTRLYGRPDDFRRFVDAAHGEGLGVILDVVYNHFGWCNNGITAFSDHYTTDRYENEWAEAIDFDGKRSKPVREFYLANCRYWIEEFHVDGYRFDATQAIYDASPRHILGEISAAARKAARGKAIYLVTENEPQNTRMLRSPDDGGHGLDAAWNDDFHHAAVVRLTNTRRAYFSDYRGDVEELLFCMLEGFLYQGQLSQWQQKPRGTPTAGLPAHAFITFLQNHDQVANSCKGERIDRRASASKLRAMTTLWLLSPQTPMFFQGQEFAASNPFLYFADVSGEHGQSVVEGRLKFLSQFPELSTAETLGAMPAANDPASFERSKLNFAERETHRPMYELHRDLLALRRDDPVFALRRPDRIAGARIGDDAMVVRFASEDGSLARLLLVNFGMDLDYSPAPLPLLAPPNADDWQVMFSSEDPRYGGNGTAPVQGPRGWFVPGEAAVVLRSRPRVTAHATGSQDDPS